MTMFKLYKLSLRSSATGRKLQNRHGYPGYAARIVKASLRPEGLHNNITRFTTVCSVGKVDQIGKLRIVDKGVAVFLVLLHPIISILFLLTDRIGRMPLSVQCLGP